ncbi:GNAT family N-acetyltransferase [Piscinibacter defluvii]|uniref:GNAT family N-acetyltransferase n=1 Tax=Piscinibacter defluvii TaxID=1796922 RepID=UPI000FDF58AE|nr:GNAT family N-acetyltransferase [Piscinibacter defluvii]
MTATPLAWRWLRFAEFDLQGLYEVLALRQQVFILEQGPYLDADGLDQHSWHLLGRDAAGTLLAYLRVVDPGHKYDEPSIGRVVTVASQRGTGLGHALMAEAVAGLARHWPGRANRISAQAHLQRYYGRHGYAAVGEPYLEDGIPHIEMLRPPDA